MLSALILASFQLAPLRVTSEEATRVEAAIVERGVQTRIGSLGDDWVIILSPDPLGVNVHARAPSGASSQESVALDGDDPNARAIAVASVVALIIEQHHEPADSPPPDSPASAASSLEHASSSRPHASVDLHGGLQSNVHRDAALAGTLALGAGAWLLSEHVRLEGSVAWQHRRTQGLAVHGALIRAGLLGGSRLRHEGGPVWLGAGLLVGPSWNVAVDRERASEMAAVIELPVALAVDLSPRWLLVGRMGASFRLPPIRFIGDRATLRWKSVRPFAAIGLGIRLP